MLNHATLFRIYCYGFNSTRQISLLLFRCSSIWIYFESENRFKCMRKPNVLMFNSDFKILNESLLTIHIATTCHPKPLHIVSCPAWNHALTFSFQPERGRICTSRACFCYLKHFECFSDCKWNFIEDELQTLWM